MKLKLNQGKIFLSLPSIIKHLLTLDSRIMLAGGAVRSLVDHKAVEDYDLFFQSKEALNECKTLLSSNLFRGTVKKLFECPEGKLTTYRIGSVKIQLISERFYKSVDALLDSFDFTICQFALTNEPEEEYILHTTRKAIRHTRKKELHVHKLEYPAASLKRMQKYSKKGYDTRDVYKEFTHRLLSQPTEVVDMFRMYID
jgi:hypothetical protein